MNFANPDRPYPVILSAAKDLSVWRIRSFAALRMTRLDRQMQKCARLRSVGTRGGCGEGWGPCACPRGNNILLGFDEVPLNYIYRTRTSTRPPHPLRSTPCPYRRERPFRATLQLYWYVRKNRINSLWRDKLVFLGGTYMFYALQYVKHGVEPGCMLGLREVITGERISVVEQKLFYRQVILDQHALAVGMGDTFF